MVAPVSESLKITGHSPLYPDRISAHFDISSLSVLLHLIYRAEVRHTDSIKASTGTILSARMLIFPSLSVESLPSMRMRLPTEICCLDAVNTCGNITASISPLMSSIRVNAIGAPFFAECCLALVMLHTKEALAPSCIFETAAMSGILRACAIRRAFFSG